ncbi:cytochrome c-type biogenesis protein CcmH [Halomonas sp. MCCC 1A17488]|uniref:Cytochrome c-type biogenesis protein n=1 Tax=Billgrantia sulfidoxydans TaxID=2733484 RepID=A0ABX7W1H9_9GAMM|nr:MULTISPECIES: cytochrome c-type biogenesis protein [Halomonas]MCE8016663.1 cytochrome c-type biogenesis protein CcmH [Halomonas sp. MCCC 1A17488]MCG3239996.1 cytochrome c-type biogenesis protein CcmH [Halomonas sp. MCCC 1A17488]QPP50114.1 cytochrome c-type biogenesis protein CcmH [Halomonas sp. SS10-MC5]QTP53726.1 cytochrome c-type biogenesis protein CcmH [Halomonas sulfidoxydans]
MAVIRWMLVAMALMLAAGLVQGAAIEVREFDDPVLEKRYHSLTASMRCPTCQNQAINDSDAPVSGDMRDRVYLLLQEGRSDMEIRDHMVQRFGDYILYNPRLEGRTYLLWGLPAVLVVAGAVLVMLLVRARRNASLRALSDEERRRLETLINRGEGQ